MDDLAKIIHKAPRSTPVKAYIWECSPVPFPGCRVFTGTDGCKIVMGQWADVEKSLIRYADDIADCTVEWDRRNSAIPLLDIRNISARIEPGAIIRHGVSIGENAVILMGAILNSGVSVGRETMVDMGAVIGSGVQIGVRCHIGAGAVLAGMTEPVSTRPVVIEDGVLIGANAVVLEGVRVGSGAVVGAGAVVTRDVPPGWVAVGCPAKPVRKKDEKTAGKTRFTDDLRK